MGNSSQGHKESGMTEATLHTCFSNWVPISLQEVEGKDS